MAPRLFITLPKKAALASFLLLLGILLADRIVKLVTCNLLEPSTSVPVIGRLLQLTYVQNTGAAFSMLSQHTWILIVVNSVLLVVCIGVLLLKVKKAVTAIPLAMIIGGGLGNLVDRLYYGYVIDMFDLRHFAVFNVADIFVCAGCALLGISLVIFGDKK